MIPTFLDDILAGLYIYKMNHQRWILRRVVEIHEPPTEFHPPPPLGKLRIL